MANETVTLQCSFCGKSQSEVRKLIAGPAVYICDECIGLCNDIIAEERDRDAASLEDPRGVLPGQVTVRPGQIEALAEGTAARLWPLVSRLVATAQALRSLRESRPRSVPFQEFIALDAAVKELTELGRLLEREHRERERSGA